jgi:hypothetical protein
LCPKFSRPMRQESNKKQAKEFGNELGSRIISTHFLINPLKLLPFNYCLFARLYS